MADIERGQSQKRSCNIKLDFNLQGPCRRVYGRPLMIEQAVSVSEACQIMRQDFGKNLMAMDNKNDEKKACPQNIGRLQPGYSPPVIREQFHLSAILQFMPGEGEG